MPPKKRRHVDAPESIADALQDVSNVVHHLNRDLIIERSENQKLLARLDEAEGEPLDHERLGKGWRMEAERLLKQWKEEKQKFASLEAGHVAKLAEAQSAIGNRYTKVVEAAKAVTGSNALELGGKVQELNDAVLEL